jgi:hypothetical protein
MILTNITDLIFYRTDKRFKELCDREDQIHRLLKSLELEKLKLERELLDIEIAQHELERNIVADIMKRKG